MEHIINIIFVLIALIVITYCIYKDHKKKQALEKEVKLLRWRIRELEQGNPVPRRGDTSSDVRRDYTGGILDER